MSSKARPPRLLKDKKNGRYFIKVGSKRHYFEEGIHYKDAVSKLLRGVRAKVKRKRKKHSIRNSNKTVVSIVNQQPGSSGGDEEKASTAPDMSGAYEAKLGQMSNANDQYRSEANAALEKSRKENDEFKATAEKAISDSQAEAKRQIDEQKMAVLNAELEYKRREGATVDEQKKLIEKIMKLESKMKTFNDLAKRAPGTKANQLNRNIKHIQSQLQRIIQNEDVKAEDLVFPKAKDVIVKSEEEMPDLQADDDEQSGDGRLRQQVKRDGLYSDQIDSMMSDYVKDGYLGCISCDEIDQLIKPSLYYDKFGFVMNKDPSTKPGSHWVACYIDTIDDLSLEYYDPFGENPEERFFSDIKNIIDAHKPDVYLKFKINRIKDQRENSSLCGFHSMRFLMSRFDGKEFRECSGYSDVLKAEKKAKGMLSKADKFGYI